MNRKPHSKKLIAGATLHIAHIIDIRRLTTIDPDSVSLAEAQQYGKSLLNEYADKAKAEGYGNVKMILESGSPKRDRPMTIAQKYAIGLTLSGATGLNAIDRFLIGSVLEQIVRHAKCDVFVVRESYCEKALQGTYGFAECFFLL